MNNCPLRLFIPAFIILASSLLASAQSGDSLLHRLDNGLFKNDREKYDLLCRIIANTSEDTLRIRYCDRAIELAGKLRITPAQPYIYKGAALMDAGNLPVALECFIKAANYYREKGNDKGLAAAYLSVSETYSLQEDYPNVRYYLNSAIGIYEKIKDSVHLASALHNLGYAYYKMGKYDSALIFLARTKDMLKKYASKYDYALCLGNSGLAYCRLSDYDKAESNLLSAIDILTWEKDMRGVTEFTIEYASILQHKGEIRKAIDCAERAYRAAVRNKYREYERDAAGKLASLFGVTRRYDSAYYFQGIFLSANDSLKNIENVQKMADLRTGFEVSKKQAEVVILEKNRSFQRIVILGLAIILILAVGLILLYRYSLKRSRKLSAALDERRRLLEKQSSELKEKNDRIIMVNEELERLYQIANNQKEEIISSINYAERIQHALLQREDTVQDTFILFLPKDIVSGDFYWFCENEEYLFIAAVDCTGHGVPGAFMSIIGQYALNKVVKEKSVFRTAEILNQVNVEVMETLLHHDEKAINDGMDISLIAMDRKNGMIEFSGAFSPLYIVSNGGLDVYKGNKFPIGKITYDSKLHFTSQMIRTQPGDMIYLFSDGYADQVGQKTGKKFMSKNLQRILSEIYILPPVEQKYRLEKEFSEWKGDREQVDDVLFIGIRITAIA
ncbi:MAG TPA: tetratricopeptide repeat protein [Bacteroidales bacterium]|nr:tetratricopeptide repeat protein [Bacteroidales bacterium]